MLTHPCLCSLHTYLLNLGIKKLKNLFREIVAIRIFDLLRRPSRSLCLLKPPFLACQHDGVPLPPILFLLPRSSSISLLQPALLSGAHLGLLPFCGVSVLNLLKYVDPAR